MNTPNSPPEYTKCLPIQVAAISKTPINTRSPRIRVIIPSGSQMHNLGLTAGRLKTPFLLGFREVAEKRWVNGKRWKMAEIVPNVLPKVYP